MQQGISKGGSVTQVTKCLSSSHLGKVSLQFDDPAPEHLSMIETVAMYQ